MAQTYRQYKKGVEKLGAKQIATPEEYAIVQRRLDKIYKKKFKTVRTSAVEKRLRKAGLTEAEINRLRGKK